jgi:hypothetical protein
MRWFLSLLVCWFAVCLPTTARAQYLTGPQFYLPTLNSAVDDGLVNPIWFYINGLIAGANTAFVLAHGEPKICQAHPIEDVQQTHAVILEYLVRYDLLDKEYAALEIVVVAAYSEAYPCNLRSI